MLDVKKKVAVMKFIGEILSNPAKFKDHLELKMQQEGDSVTGTFKATGPMAELLRENGNVQGTMEAGNKI